MLLESGYLRKKKLQLERVIHRDNPLKLVEILSGKDGDRLSPEADFGLLVLEHFMGKRFFGEK
jgi:hypothetical protein